MKKQPKPREDDCSALMARRAEQAVIGVMVLAPKAYGKITTLLSLEDFEESRCRRVMECAARLQDRGVPMDSLTLLREMKLKEEQENRAAAFLAECAAAVPCTSNLSEYCRMVKEASNRRKLVSECQACVQAVLSGTSAKEASESLRAFVRSVMEREKLL